MNNLFKNTHLALPDSYIIIFGLMLLAALLTYLIPSGSYERVASDFVATVVPNSYTIVKSNPIGFLDFFKSIQIGLIRSAGIVSLVLIIGGAFAVIESTGAINAGIMKLIDKTKDRKFLLVLSVCTVFSIAGFLGVLHTAVIAFIPIGVLIARAFNLDAIVGVALIYLGAYSGYTIGGLDPVTTGFAQQIAELPIFSGLWFRFVVYIAVLISTILYIMRYIHILEKDLNNSIMGENRFGTQEDEGIQEMNLKFTLRRKIILLYFVLSMIAYTVGVFRADWGLNEMSAVFIIIAIGVACIEGITPNGFVQKFVKGAQGMVYAALIVGLARAIVVILEQGMVLDTLVYSIASYLEPLHPLMGIQGMYVFNLLFNLIVTSGSGQAAIVMPVMTPLADIMEINRQISVLAYNFGDGFTNTIAPTSGILMASIAVARVSWTKWLRFMLPLLLIWIIIGAIALTIAYIIDLGPF